MPQQFVGVTVNEVPERSLKEGARSAVCLMPIISKLVLVLCILVPCSTVGELNESVVSLPYNAEQKQANGPWSLGFSSKHAMVWGTAR